MAQQPVSERTGASLARAGKRKLGYDVAQVDSFLERAHHLYEDDEPKMTQEDIQNVSFAVEKNGYVIAQVDAALNRLEKAVVDKQTQWDVSSYGRVAWRADTERLAHSLYSRAERPARERFSDGLEKRPSYDRKQVDRLIDQLVGKIKRDLGESGDAPSEAQRKADAELGSTRVSNIIFTQRTGRKGYSERQVDAYLNRAVQVLSRLESFARLEGPLSQVTSQGDEVDGTGAETAVADAKSAGFTSADSADSPAVAVPTMPMNTQNFGDSPAASVPPAPTAPITPVERIHDASQPQVDAFADGEMAPAAIPPAARRRTVSSQHDRSFYDLRKAESEIFNNAAPTATVAGPAAKVSGSLEGLVNASADSAAAPAVSDDHDSRTVNLAEPTVDLSAARTHTPVVRAPAPAVEPHVTPVAAPESVEPHVAPVVDRGIPTGDGGSPTENDGGPAKGSVFDAKDEADDYFAALLDTSSMPAVDFHIPNLTFPSVDDDLDDHDRNGKQA
ncbi:hypothetical protein Uis1B_0615 [Bifidobacterium margollesii]|uniref:Cell division protein DivIVA n=1 Tax=Bifidobacterium margollesii TaxID=2020964 RepID=A0A2N5JBN8_9BIFI|nr:DivIVA domain-containing protein [Bifidobacterium margollesii]PLS31623.1 hypothetical protein Uis1B_0615 [Bifidobacterium margollesii]